MLGESGLWFKMSFYEGLARVQLMVASPDLAPKAVTIPASSFDVCPELFDLAGVSMASVMPWTSGESLLPLVSGGTRSKPMVMKYAAKAPYAPTVSLCSDRWKYIRRMLDPEQLFDLEVNPNELQNLASNLQYGVVIRGLRAQSQALWDLDRFDADVRGSQALRWVVCEGLRKRGRYPWDYQPLQKSSEYYVRNHMDLNNLEAQNVGRNQSACYFEMFMTLSTKDAR
jgi:choline-sulfatase